MVGLHTYDTDFLATLLVGLKDILHLHELFVVQSTQLNHIPWSDLSSLRVLELRIYDNDAILGLDTTLSALSLESLDIDGVGFEPSLDHEDCVALARAASTLKALKLHKISILKIGVEVITKALVSNQSLYRLKLTCDCFFTDTAVDCLAQFITNSTTLQYLGAGSVFVDYECLPRPDTTPQYTPRTLNVVGWMCCLMMEETSMNWMNYSEYTQACGTLLRLFNFLTIPP